MLCLLMAGMPGSVAAAEVRIGVLAWFGNHSAQMHWHGLGSALQKRLPGVGVSLLYLDMVGLEKAVAAGDVDFIITNPGHYVALEARHGMTRIATQKITPGQDSEFAVGSAVIVRTERADLQSLDDLRGKRLAATVEDGFSGWLVIWAELKRRDIDPEEGDVTPLFTGFPMTRIIDAVDSGESDAGILRGCLLEHLIRQGAVPADRYRVLSARDERASCLMSSPTYPGWAFAAARQTPEELARTVLIALLSLKDNDAVLRWGVPADYYPVHEMLRSLHVVPYDFLREHRLEVQIRRYWPIAVTFVVLLLLWLLYTLRVEVLVLRRSRELSAALTARQALEESIETQRQKMEHLSRLSILGELSCTLAHELNQPLATIGNYARSLTRRLQSGKLSEDAVGQAAHEITEQSERAAGILLGIRDFSRKRARQREDCDAGKMVGEIVALFRGMVARAPAIRIVDRLPAEQKTIHVDRLQIQQVLLNLLKNAYDAHSAAEQTSLPIDIILETTDERVRIAVRDHGPGLAIEDRARLFEPFFTTKPDGMGLGLSICKSIVEAHGGQLVAESPTDGDGLSFSFTLPHGSSLHDQQQD
ncbi:MAG: PhnD/SsuA/transferrin family substrate-binding protein [Azoarcus sp.]|nr:PhnD/SsuA/transferrin family substrate-binding protein [Azoarcus sp.]